MKEGFRITSFQVGDKYAIVKAIHFCQLTGLQMICIFACSNCDFSNRLPYGAFSFHFIFLLRILVLQFLVPSEFLFLDCRMVVCVIGVQYIIGNGIGFNGLVLFFMSHVILYSILSIDSYLMNPVWRGS